jgi:hypothetical protein
MLAFPFPYIATTPSWMTREIGRQPCLVSAMTTCDERQAFSTRTRSDFERGTSDRTQLTPGAPIAGRRHVVRLRDLTIVAVMQAADFRRDDERADSGTRRPAVPASRTRTIL